MSLAEKLGNRLVGQAEAIDMIVPYVQMFNAGLAPEGRPAGVFLLLGPTGTGKTKTVEALADVLHGSERNVVRVDCGEFQMDHEVAKLIGAPPGYLGHRETTPMLTQQKLAGVASESSSLSLVLFDEIEKAAPSMTRLLLGVLDKASLRLGDNSTVNFEKSMIFLTSNLGGEEITRALGQPFGLACGAPAKPKVGKQAIAAAKRKFSPEFLNRIDAMVTYEPLSRDALWRIMNVHIEQLQQTITQRLDDKAFELFVTRESRLFLLRKGTSMEFGARELKRTIQRNVTQVLGAMVSAGEIAPGSQVKVDLESGGEGLVVTVQ